MTSAQTSQTPAKMSSSVLILPTPGAPISFEQIEERRESGGAAVEALRMNVYRDSSGRVCMQEIMPPGGKKSGLTRIVDPVASHVIALTTEKTGYLFSFPKSGEARFTNFALAGSQDEGTSVPSLKTERLGKRIFEGIEFDGTRMTAVREGEPRSTKTVEQWQSADLKLIGLMVVSKGDTTYTVRIQRVRREEPSPDLFRIPPGYEIFEVP
jgi:hypothetical protein